MVKWGGGVCTGGISVFRDKRDFVKENILKKVSRGVGSHTTLRRRTLGSQATLSLAAPQRELREAKEDGIERKDGMYDVEHSSRRNKSIITNVNQRTCVPRFWSRHCGGLQLGLRRVHV